jgi:DNA-binding protein H-NS
MPSYQDYQKQIAELQALAEKARQVELAEARSQIGALMKSHGLSRSDVLSAEKKTTVVKKGTVQAKYRDPETGKTWTGRGREPLWLNGRDRRDFLIE